MWNNAYCKLTYNKSRLTVLKFMQNMKVECLLCGFTHLSCIDKHNKRIKKSFVKANKV